MELNLLKSEIADHLNHLSEWMAPNKVSVALVNAMDGCQVRSEPFGVVLVIGAWNYPLQLTLVWSTSSTCRCFPPLLRASRSLPFA